MYVPLAGEPVAKYPVALPGAVPCDVVIPAGGFPPPVVLDALRTINQVQGTIPVQAMMTLTQGLRLLHQPERALSAVLAGAVLVSRLFAADVYRKLWQVFIAAADLLDRL